MGSKSKKHWVVAGLAAATAGWWLVGGCATPAPTGGAAVSSELPAKLVTQGHESPIERGKYLVAIGSCSDCHTPLTMTAHGPAPDEARAFSGHPAGMKITGGPKIEMPWIMAGVATNTAFAGPWGVSFAINLTPDKVSGLGGGGWDEARFIKAMRTGKHFGEARPILPPMPWHGLSQATDEDLKAIWAFLQTVPPIRNEVPAAIPPGGGMPHP